MARKPCHEGLEERIRQLEEELAGRKRAEETLQVQKVYLEHLLDCAPEAIVLADRNHRITRTNAQFNHLFGYTPEEAIGKICDDLIAPAERFNEASDITFRVGHGEAVRVETVRCRKDGSPVVVELMAAPIHAGEEHIGDYVSYRDVTERKRAEEEMRASEEKFRAAFDGSQDAITITTKDGRFVDCNQKALEMFRLSSKAGFGGKRPAGFSPEYQPNGRRSHEAALEHVNKATREGSTHFEWAHQRSTGETFPTEIILTSYQLRGETVLHATIRDISDRKKAEEEKEKLQAQLLQSQKMESVGRLAGGVAHDFNNMLGIIIGNAELAALKVDPDDTPYQNLQEILKASHRSADMVRQLLAFARKQTISPKVLDLNDTVSGMLKMLQRLIGEDVDLVWVPGHELWPVKIDPSQVNQILANLAVNARDAIAGVGKLTIETDNVTFDEAYCAVHEGFLPGQYVLLAVSDSGTGMPKEVLDHLFEPFFTTKGVGKGTGLGLSTIYGIVKQNNGFVNVYSEPGQGTTFKIYLPQFLSGALEIKVEKEPDTLPGGTETVLMVEDEDAILRIGRAMLEALGYTVLTATTPGEAIRMVGGKERQIQLVITDVVMPEMNGRDLADRLKDIYPDLKCLYMSGYTANVIAHHGVLEEGVVFIQKPFSTKELAVKVREVLDKG